MRILATLLIAGIAATGAYPVAVANDTMASMAGGGLIFERTDKIEMVSEALRISPSEIEVNYVFKNVSGSEVSAIVAFPLPDLSLEFMAHDSFHLPIEGNPNFVNFHTWADRQEVVPEIEVRSYLNETHQEITDGLRKFNIDPLTGNLQNKNAAAPSMPAEWFAGDNTDRFPNWITKVSFHWQQVFPPGEEVRIRHVYQPVSGFGLIGPAGDSRACPDKGFKKAILKLPRYYEWQGNDASYVDGEWVEYVLKTGANWATPIGTFTITLDKGDSDVISTCPIPGLTLRRKGNTFVATAKNYLPSEDLFILFARGRCPKGAACPKESTDPR